MIAITIVRYLIKLAYLSLNIESIKCCNGFFTYGICTSIAVYNDFNIMYTW